MATIISESSLKKAVEEGTFIKNGIIDCAEGVKYDFRMGNYLLKAEFGIPIDMNSLKSTERTKLFIEPGEVVFVLSDEDLDLPENITAMLSPKRKLSHNGIMVLGGFCIDPLYKGKLLVGLYNISSTKFPLMPGKKMIAAVFYELSESESIKYTTPEASINDFPDDLIRIMQNYRHTTLDGLQDKLMTFQKDLIDLKSEIHERRDWQVDFQKKLDQHQLQIEQLLEGLEKESSQRREAGKEYREELKIIQRDVFKNAAKFATIISLSLIVIGTLLAIFIPKLIH